MVSLEIFSVVPPTEPCALKSTQPLKVSTRDFSWGKGGRCVWLTTYHPCNAETSRKSAVLTYPEPLGPPGPVAGDLYFYFYFINTIYHYNSSRDSSVGTATRYGLSVPGIESRCGSKFSASVQTLLGPTHPPLQWVPGHSQG